MSSKLPNAAQLTTQNSGSGTRRSSRLASAKTKTKKLVKQVLEMSTTKYTSKAGDRMQSDINSDTSITNSITDKAIVETVTDFIVDNDDELDSQIEMQQKKDTDIEDAYEQNSNGKSNKARRNDNAPDEKADNNDGHSSHRNAWGSQTHSITSAPPDLQGQWDDDFDNTNRENNEHGMTSALSDGEENKQRRRSRKKSLQKKGDDLAAFALAGTYGLLRGVGGLTLSTTGKLVAPSIHMTRTLLLPQIYHALAEIARQYSSPRVKDWYRIIKSCGRHIWAVLVQTESGQELTAQMLATSTCMLQTVASPESRQAFTDGMSTLVRGAEALDTAPVQEFLSQSAVFFCRVSQLLASGPAQELYHQFATTSWQACKVASDPSTTLALAEVTAYLCHALEMEQAHLYESPDAHTDSAKRRHARQAFQKSTYTSTLTHSDPNATVEQVILSSLGALAMGNESKEDIPNNVVIPGFKVEQNGSDDEDDDNESPGKNSGRKSTYVADKAGRNVDMQELRRQLALRAAKKKDERDHMDDDSSSALSTDELPLEDLNMAKTKSTKSHNDKENSSKQSRNERKRVAVDPDNSKKENSTDGPVTLDRNAMDRREGETSVQHFYRVLDQALATQRHETIERLSGTDTEATVATGNKNAAAPPKSKRTIEGKEQNDNVASFVQRHRRMLGFGILAMLLLALFWTALGLYGAYILLFGKSQTTSTRNFSFASHKGSDFVVRVGDELVHVDSSGNVRTVTNVKELQNLLR